MYTTNDFLVDHAYKNVWSGPGQDRQHILSPTRISLPRGTIWNVRLGMANYNLPTKSDRYDVFVFGDVLPSLLGMSELTETWINGKVHSELKNLLIDIYTKNGVRFPISQAFFMYTRHGNLVMAIRRFPKLRIFTDEDVYLKWRSPAYFKAMDLNLPKKVETGHLIYLGNNGEYSNFRDIVSEVKGRSEGHVTLFHNGYKVRDWTVALLRPEDHLEWIWSLDVKETIELKYGELLGFDSTLDNARKFLIPRPGLGDGIDYVDDVDFYILNYKKPAQYVGVYYHQNRKDAVRMVTHRDYALKASYVNSTITDQGWSTADDIRIVAVVRHSGYNRSLVDEHHRIKELFKLDESSRLNAMIGSDSGVDVWRADVLESSSYLKLMRAPLGTVVSGDVMDAYGYNAVAKLTGLVPIKKPDGSRYVDIFYGQFSHSTVFEYDVHGRLLEWHFHVKQRQYAIRNVETKYVEAYAGYGDGSLSTIYNSHRDGRDVDLEPNRSYRFYVGQTQIDGEMTNWVDVTGEDEFYTRNGNKITWGELNVSSVTAIRNDLDFLAKDLLLDTVRGELLFTVGTTEVFQGKANTYTLMSIPPGELDVFLNGYDLVEGIDYLCNWPEICIISNRYRDLTLDNQRVTIRARGFCTKEMEFDLDEDTGFVIHNQLSRNSKFNIRDDKVTKLSLGGQLRLLEDISFSEDGTFSTVVPNGTPYRVTHPYIPLLGLIPNETYENRAASRIVDEQISGYMDVYNPEVEINTPNPIMERYELVSPYISKIMEDMLAGFVSTDEWEGNYSQQDLVTRFKGYEYLLKYEPFLIGFREDLFTLRPHQRPTVELNLYQFRILDRLIAAQLNGKIELSRYVTILTKD